MITPLSTKTLLFITSPPLAPLRKARYPLRQRLASAGNKFSRMITVF